VYFAQLQGGSWALYLLDSSKPSEQKRLLTLADEIPGGSPLWAADGSGVALVVFDQAASQTPRPSYAALRTLDLASGKISELMRLTDGSSLALIGWDTKTSTLAALTVPYPSGARTYVVLSPGGKRSFPVDPSYGIYGSPNGEDVLAITCAGGSGCRLITWNLGAFDARVEHNLGPNLSLGFVGFRPNGRDVGLLVSSSNAADQAIELWSIGQGRRVVYRASQSPQTIFFRADGSALIVASRPGEQVVVDLRSGAVAPLPQPSPSTPADYPVPVASIALD